MNKLLKIKILFTFLSTLFIPEIYGQKLIDSLFEDKQFEKQEGDSIFYTSPKVDFIQIPSTKTKDVNFAIVVYKPSKPSPILLLSHGWHMSVMPPEKDSQSPDSNFLTVQVDMRGRDYSTGKPDCNGYELYDFYDAYMYVIANYKSFISDNSQVYYSGASGGGGNGYAIVGKFPDLFCSANIGCGISDYALWFENDDVGEFRDDMLPWIGCTPNQNREAYASRSGLTTVSNILTPVYITHGETDIRVPVAHARNFVEKAEQLKKAVYYLELENVGDRDHWGKITKEQDNEKNSFQQKALSYKKPPMLPKKGKLVVAGYIVTKNFSVFMDSIDSVGEIEYNLSKKSIKFLKGKGQVIWLAKQ